MIKLFREPFRARLSNTKKRLGPAKGFGREWHFYAFLFYSITLCVVSFFGRTGVPIFILGVILLIHYISSESFKGLIQAASGFGAILAIVLSIGIYKTETLVADKRIERAISIEVISNASLHDAIRNNSTQSKYEMTYASQFLSEYIRAYPQYVIRETKKVCLENYINYLTNIDFANRYIGEMSGLEGDTNKGIKVSQIAVASVAKRLFKINDWAYLNYQNMKDNKCFLN